MARREASKQKAETSKQRKAAKKKPARPEPPPWARMLMAYERFLADVECMREMFDQVAPLLSRVDQDKRAIVDKAAEEMLKITKKSFARKPKRLTELVEHSEVFRRNVIKIERGSAVFREQAVVSLVTRYDAYCFGLLRNMLRAYPGRMSNSEAGLTYDDMWEMVSIEEVREKLIENYVRGIADRGRPELLTWLEKALSIELKSHIGHWTTFMELCERRNVIVHRGGIIDRQYFRQCKTLKATVPPGVVDGKRATLTDEYIDRGRQATFFTGLVMGDQVFRALFPKALKAADNMLTDIGLNYINGGDHATGTTIFEYARTLPDEMVSDEMMRRLFVINHALALKRGGDKKGCLRVIDGCDWSATEKRLHFGVAVLRDETKRACVLMRELVMSKELQRHEIHMWPILQEFRRTDEFRGAYKKIFKQDFVPGGGAKQADPSTGSAPALALVRISETEGTPGSR